MPESDYFEVTKKVKYIIIFGKPDSMDKERLLQLTGRYLEDFLEEYAQTGRPLPDEERFREIYGHGMLPQATRRDFIDAASKIDSPLVIDIASFFHGERFGMWIASMNSSAEVHVYNPAEIDDGFAQVLFNEHNKYGIFKLKKKVPFNIHDQDGSVNSLYSANGLDNIVFHQEKITDDKLEEYAGLYPDRTVVLYASRICWLYPMISDAVGRHRNFEMVIDIVTNSRVDTLKPDSVVDLINKGYYKDLRQFPCSTMLFHPSAIPQTRLITAMNQYHSLKAAIMAGADIFYEGVPVSNYPMHQATHYVSTIQKNGPSRN